MGRNFIAGSYLTLKSIPAYHPQRRRCPPLPELSIMPKQLLLSMLRGCLQEQLPPHTLRKVFLQVIE